MTTLRGPEINQGLITNWIALTTPGPPRFPCSSSLYFMPGEFSRIIAFDPWYGKFIDPSVRCLETEASLWWNQHSEMNPIQTNQYMYKFLTDNCQAMVLPMISILDRLGVLGDMPRPPLVQSTSILHLLDAIPRKLLSRLLLRKPIIILTRRLENINFSALSCEPVHLANVPLL
jgi:hypothetical protein